MVETDTQTQKRFDNVSRSKTFRNIISTLNLDKMSVLDIGCSYGEFLAHFGPGSCGLTLGHDHVEYAKRHDLNVKYGNIEEGDLSIGRFDVIFANNIFEHLNSPHKFLITIKKYLKDDGILILGVPCIPRIRSLMCLEKFRGSLASAHINFFTRETLKLTAERAGWTVFQVRGFRFASKCLDSLLNPIYPHFYVITKIDKDFVYSSKRMKDLAGYKEA